MNPDSDTPPPSWHLYLIECRDGSYYAGITNDLEARYQAHVNGKGARYTRSHPPVRLMGSRPYENRAAASRAEWEIKQLPKHRKLGYLLNADTDTQPAEAVAPITE